MAFTYFFRDMQTLELIRDNCLKSLASRQRIKIWDAGCAMGPEPYSLSIIFRENVGYMYFRNIKIIATDIDQSQQFDKIILDGIYPREQVERIPKEILSKYFVDVDGGKYFQIIEEIRKSVSFRRHDLLTLKPIEESFDLILCKNVLLHFSYEERIKVLTMFYNSLNVGGFLAVEQTQKIPNEIENLFVPIVSNAQLFKKSETQAAKR